MYYTIQDVKQANARAGHHFFEPATLRFFRGRVLEFTANTEDNVYFVTSERFDYRSPRLYTVRMLDKQTGHVDTVGKFQAYRTAAKAKAAARFIAGGN